METEETPTTDPIASADRLSEALEGFTGKLEEVNKKIHRGKIWDWLLTLSLTLDVLLTVVIGTVVYQNHNLTQELQTAQIASCQSSNVVRQEDVHLWDQAIADIAPKPYKSATEAAGVAKFIAEVNQTFAQHNCSLASQSSTTTTSVNKANK